MQNLNGSVSSRFIPLGGHRGAKQNRHATDAGALKIGRVQALISTPSSSKFFTMMRLRQVPDAHFMEPNWDFCMIRVERAV